MNQILSMDSNNPSFGNNYNNNMNGEKRGKLDDKTSKKNFFNRYDYFWTSYVYKWFVRNN